MQPKKRLHLKASILSWLVQIWDTTGDGTILDSTEVRHLGSLSHDVGIDQGMTRRPKALSLWTQLLRSVKEIYLFQEDLQLQESLWKTMEQGIQCFRELAVIEIIFSDDQMIKSPDMEKCAPVMWLKLAQLGPQEYAPALAMMK